MAPTKSNPHLLEQLLGEPSSEDKPLKHLRSGVCSAQNPSGKPGLHGLNPRRFDERDPAGSVVDDQAKLRTAKLEHRSEERPIGR